MDNLLGQGPCMVCEEYLEKIITDPPRRNRNSLLDGLTVLPTVISSLIQNIPMPWESSKKMLCYYSTDGIICSLKGKHSEDEVNYLCHWASSVIALEMNIDIPPHPKKWSIPEYLSLQAQLNLPKKTPVRSNSTNSTNHTNHTSSTNHTNATTTSKPTQSITNDLIPNPRRVLLRESISFLPKEKPPKKVKSVPSPYSDWKLLMNTASSTTSAPTKQPASLKKDFCSTMEWTKLARLVVILGRRVLSYVLEERKIKYCDIKKNKQPSPKRKISTKEKKKSRMGQSYHVLREILTLLDRIVALFEDHQAHTISKTDLMQGLFQEFSSVGTTTGIYRYKYSVVKQIAQTNRITKILSQSQKYGTMLWCEVWRVWVFFLQGLAPVLSSRLAAYVERRRTGRTKRLKPITKQRKDSNTDIETKAQLIRECRALLHDITPKEERKVKLAFSQAWKRWKADNIFEEHQPKLNPSLAKLVNVYIEEKSVLWINETLQGWKHILSGKATDKKQVKKVQGRMLRLIMKIHRSLNLADALHFLHSSAPPKPPQLNPLQAHLFSLALPSNAIPTRLSLDSYSPNDLEHFALNAIEELRSQYTIRQQLTAKDKAELSYLDQCKTNLTDLLQHIRATLEKKKTFSAFEIEFLDSNIIYSSTIKEKIVDRFLELMLWHFAKKNNLFGSHLFPIDSEPLPVSYLSIGDKIKTHLTHWATTNTEPLHFIAIDYSPLLAEIEFSFLLPFLEPILAPELFHYISRRLAATVTYKDMSYVQKSGLFPGLEFHSFLLQYYLLFVDAQLIQTSLTQFNQTNIMLHANSRLTSQTSPIKGYIRCGTIAYAIYTSSNHPLDSSPATPTQSPILTQYQQTPRAAPINTLLDLVSRSQVPIPTIHSAILTQILARITQSLSPSSPQPQTLTQPQALTQTPTQLPTQQPTSYLLSQLTPLSRQTQPFILTNIPLHNHPISLPLGHLSIILNPAKVSLQTPPEAITPFKLAIAKIRQDALGSAFSTIVRRWNSLLLRTVLFYREALSDQFIAAIIVAEKAVRDKIMQGVNSRQKKRYPSFLFYAEKEVGGLNLISAKALIRACPSWADEIAHSEAAYTKIESYLESQKQDSDQPSIHNAIKHLAAQGIPIHSTGIPRLSLFLKRTPELALEQGWRPRLYIRYGVKRWTSENHDGRWVFWDAYKQQLTLPKAQNLQRHSLFAAAIQRWTSQTPTEPAALPTKTDLSQGTPLIGIMHSIEHKTHSRAQLGELARLPNRMFVFWWSPVINRSHVNIGQPVHVENTGIYISGKLSSLRVSYTKLFSDNLWPRMHAEAISLVFAALDRNALALNISYLHTNDSGNYSPEHYALASLSQSISDPPRYLAATSPSLLVRLNTEAAALPAWVIVRLRWGNIDSPALEEEAESWASEMITIADNFAPIHSKIGVVVLLDISQAECCVLPTHPTIAPAATIIKHSLLSSLPFANTFRVFQRRIRSLAGFNPSLFETQTTATEPSHLFKEPNSIYMVLSPQAIHSLNLTTGAYLSIPITKGEKIVRIFDHLFRALPCISASQHIFAEDKLYSLLVNSGRVLTVSRSLLSFPLTQPLPYSQLYTHWPGLSPYTAFCRLALILRHSLEVNPASLVYLTQTQSDRHWIAIENQLITDLFLAATKRMHILGEALLEEETAQDTLKALVFAQDRTQFRLVSPTVQKHAWTSIINWRDRYALGVPFFPPTSTSSTSTSTSTSTPPTSTSTPTSTPPTATIPLDFFSTLLAAADPLVPILALITQSTPTVLSNHYDLLIVPSQSFASKHFTLTTSDISHYSIKAILQTTTPFSNDLTFTYSGVSLPSSILLIQFNLTTGEHTTTICTVKNTHHSIFELIPQTPTTIQVQPSPANYLTTHPWNQNLHSFTTPPILLPQKPQPFYAEEFRPHHFHS
ncbi:pre-mRNA-processing factor 8 [Nematocida homosporus]|uniref:pre-mRNA-processing factor 8 n=1 Tax=Nematocida homosporus TaxID=1912981 RepID=UPI0022211FCA|nr:pre-mRNA-processing factor 8 [Nematocida homosporus]KAI5184772.1 pre-mRNA-processing factor 8 [Nematocida homosporus]